MLVVDLTSSGDTSMTFTITQHIYIDQVQLNLNFFNTARVQKKKHAGTILKNYCDNLNLDVGREEIT